MGKEIGLARNIAESRHLNMFLPRHRIKEIQTTKLKKLVSFARANSKFYRNLYGPIDEDNFQLDELPIIDKATVMEEFDDIITDDRCTLGKIEKHLSSGGGAIYEKEIHIRCTSGTSGFRGIFLYDADGWAHTLSIIMSPLPGAPQFFPDDHVGVFAGKSPIDISQSMIPIMRKSGFEILGVYHEEPIEESCKRLNEFQPSILYGYAYDIHSLCHEQIAGNLEISPRLTLCGGETCSDAMKALWKKTWNTEVFEDYGASESIFIARQCGEHRMHIFEDMNILEVVDEKNRPVPAGEPGAKVLLTVLYNKLQPLIRYELPDGLIVSEEPCPCGCTFNWIQKVLGKSDDVSYFHTVSGRKVAVHPNTFRVVVEAIEDIRRYRIYIGENNIDIDIIDKPNTNRGQIEQLVISTLRSRLDSLNIGSDLKISLRYVAELPKMGTVKEKNIIFRKENK
jgi:putative adenylate-forming enzyme